MHVRKYVIVMVILVFFMWGISAVHCIGSPPPPPEQPETTQFPYEIVIQVVLFFGLLGVLVFIYVKRKK